MYYFKVTGLINLSPFIHTVMNNHNWNTQQSLFLQSEPLNKNQINYSTPTYENTFVNLADWLTMPYEADSKLRKSIEENRNQLFNRLALV